MLMKEFVLHIFNMIGIICVINFLWYLICPTDPPNQMEIIMIGVVSYLIEDKLESI